MIRAIKYNLIGYCIGLVIIAGYFAFVLNCIQEAQP